MDGNKKKGDVNMKKNEAVINELRKVLAYDEALGKLHEAGVAEEFLTAVEKQPELMSAIKKIGPGIGPGPVADWSCCITVSSPIHKPGEDVINPADKVSKQVGKNVIK